MLRLPAFAPVGKSYTPAQHSCCGHCRTAEQPPGQPTPEPLPPGKCPCTDRDAASADTARNAGADLIPTLPPAVIDLAPSPVGHSRLIGLPVISLDNSLRDFSCVWLC
jgi:hypothetical protein